MYLKKKLYPTHNSISSCTTVHYLEITLIGLLSYTIVAYKYTNPGREMKLSMCISLLKSTIQIKVMDYDFT